MNPVLPWLILLAPAVAAGGITLTALRRPAAAARWSIGAILIAFAASLELFRHGAGGQTALVWLDLPGLRVDFGLRVDPLSLLMLVVVTGVAAAIHIYSWGYMRGEPGLPRYFAGLSLFTFAMLGIVLATNLIQLFVFWELVGVSSYLLIGFWFERPAAADAARKAFLTNRVGDYGFFLGIVLVWSVWGTLDLAELEAKLATAPPAWSAVATATGLLLFCGAVGKSAQFPLHVWLPDAMEGPTPVSALIHAATMVAAGVYLLCRVFFLLNAPVLEVIAWTGGLTTLLAALLALQQNDIKRILAYSTLSQLGYMVMAVGLSGAGGNPAPAMYHLTTHAFFKALLFLGAGAVIHALHHEQDIWKMGGLRRKLPVTFWTFLAGTLALCGAPPLSGFFSKDAILALAWERQQYALFALGVGVAALTAFYMFRLVFVVFTGPAKSQAPDHAHEAPPVMTVPMVALTVPTLLAGFWGVDHWYSRQFGVAAGPVHGLLAPFLEPFAHAPVAAWGGLLAAAAGLVVAWKLYGRAVSDPLPALLGAPARWLRDRLYLDELYAAFIAVTQELLARGVAAVDRWVLAAGVVRGTAGMFALAGRLLRHLHTGNLQTYALFLAAGAVAVLWWVMTR